MSLQTSSVEGADVQPYTPTEPQTTPRRNSAPEVVIATVAVLALCYVAKVVLITLLISVVVAFILEPIVRELERLRLPRAAGSFVAVGLLLVCLYGVLYVSYNKAADFVDDLPKYAAKIRQSTIRFTRQAARIQQSTKSVIPESPPDQGTVRIKQETNWQDWLTNSVSGITEFLLTLSFIPFLTYFMLSWKHQTREATVRLFRIENRAAAEKALTGIARMLQGFLFGNLICGAILSVASVAVFGFFKIPYFYFLGVLSGFLSLIPYLGVILAMLTPLVAGMFSLDGGQMLAIAMIVAALHVLTVSVFFPKIIGKRLKLNPLVVTTALLMWGWIWGAMGLILAIPLAGAFKIICDHIDRLRPVGAWLGE